MTFEEELEILKSVDQQIKSESTGTLEEFATKIGVSKKCFFNTIETMKILNAPILYDIHRKTFYYEYDGKFFIGFTTESQ